MAKRKVMSSKQLKEFAEQKEHKRPYGKKYLAIAFAERRICFNWDRSDIIEAIVNQYGYTERTAELYYEKALHKVNEKYKQYQDKIAEENYRRLNAIVDEAYDKGDLKTSIDAINTLNKMGSIYEQKVNIKTDEGFVIKLDN